MEEKQKIVFGNVDFGKEYKLFEVEESLLKELEEDKNNFVLRGSPSSEAILCTRNDSFQVRMVESTNALFLFSPSSSSSNSNELFVSSSIQCHFELIKTQPRLDVLRELLYRSPYQREDSMKEGQKFTMKELKQRVQASDSQLEEGLKELGAFEKDGFVQVLDEEWKEEIIENLLVEVISNDWKFSSIPHKQIISTLSPIADEVAVSNVLSKLGEKEGKNWSIKPKQVAIFKAKKLFKTKQTWTLDDFLNEWSSSIPEEISRPSLEMLEGLIVTKNPNLIEWLPVYTLPFDNRQRMKALFEKKNFWKTKEIEPFVRNIIPPSMTTDQFLLKVSRSRKTSDGDGWGPS